MGAKQSKRSVDISGTPKKGDTENGAVAVPEEKLEKISEDAVLPKVNANGSTNTTSTVTAEQQEAAAVATETESTPTKPEKEQTPEKSEEAAVTTPSEEKEEDPSSPASPSETTEEGSSEKKKKPKKKWSFRSWSFSKKDRVKPNSKEDKQETVPEDNEAAAQSEQPQVNPEVTNVSSVQNEEPPPLPTSPPPTPAEETPAEKEETPTISEGDVDASGGGEGLAEPIEDAELEAAAPVPVVDQIAETIKEVDAKLTTTVAPIAEKIAPVAEKVVDAVEEAVAAVAELKVSTPPPVPAVKKHVEQDEDGELTVTSQIDSAVQQPLTNGINGMTSIAVNGLNGDDRPPSNS